MFYQSPYHTSPYDTYRPQQVDFLGSTRRTDPSTLRDRYLAAAAEAKLAEAQYLAAEAASQRLRDPYGPAAYAAPYPNHPRGPYNTPLSVSHLGYDEESIRLQALDSHLAQVTRARAQEQEFLRQKEELLTALAFKQRLDKEAEEERLAVLRDEERRRALAQLVPQRLSKNNSRCACAGHREFKPVVSSQCGHQRVLPIDDVPSFDGPSSQSISKAFDPSELLSALFGSQVPDSLPRQAPTVRRAAPEIKPKAPAPATSNEVPLLDLLGHLFASTTKASTTEAPKPSPSNLPVERPANHPRAERKTGGSRQHPLVESIPDLLNLLFQKPEESATQAESSSAEPKVEGSQHPQVHSLPEFLNLLFQTPTTAAQSQPSSSAGPSKSTTSKVPVENPAHHPASQPRASDSELPQVQSLPELLNLLFQKPSAPSAQAQFYSAGPSSSPSKNAEQPKEQPRKQATSVNVTTPKPTTDSLKEQLEARLNNEYAVEVKDTIQAILASLSDTKPHTPTPASAANNTATPPAPLKPESKDDVSSLKEQLAARYTTEGADEVRDTIQAILASLSEGHSTIPAALFEGKGKGKAVASEEAPVPTASDVSKSLQTVHTIETAFATLEGEFVFPAQLDFTPPSSPSTLVSPLPGTENTAGDPATFHLAYTAHNQPLRFYEHALGELLSQLDRIDSFGNDELRARRKEVVGRVERALEELEREVDSRWQVRQKKLAKEQEQATEEVSTPVQEEPQEVATEPTTAATEDLQAEVPPSPVVIPSTPEPQPSSLPEDDPALSPVELDVKQVADVPVEDIVPSILSQIDEPIVEPQESTALSQQAPLLQESAPVLETRAYDDSSAAPTTESSTATIKPTQDEKATAIDTFLLPAQPASPVTSKAHSVVDVDSASDWSEVEA